MLALAQHFTADADNAFVASIQVVGRMDKTNAAIRATNSGAQGLEPIYEAICHDIAAQLGCTRASVWLFSLAGDAIHCQCLLDRRETNFPADMILTADSTSTRRPRASSAWNRRASCCIGGMTAG